MKWFRERNAAPCINLVWVDFDPHSDEKSTCKCKLCMLLGFYNEEALVVGFRICVDLV